MKLYQLKAVCDRLKKFTYISRARRVDNNIIELNFDRDNSYFFNLTRGNSTLYKAPSQRPLQSFNAPFDVLLHSLVNASKIMNISIVKSDRVLRFELAPKSSYKDEIISLQLEFTGKNTNAILIDDNEIVIEALRHIDAQSSFRVVKPGVQLLEIPPHVLKAEESIKIDDIDALLEQEFQHMQARKLLELKWQKLAAIDKKRKLLAKTLATLPNQDSLIAQEKSYKNYANIILANLYAIKPYDTTLEAYDFDGSEIVIELPKNIKPSRMSDYYFNLSKRAKNKAVHIHIEKENLESKKRFYDNIYFAITQAKEPYELELLVPKRAKVQQKKERLKEGELFWIDDYKIFVGRNSGENQKLLNLAKSNDVWMHIRDIPSSHVIIRTDKQNLPQSVIASAAKLCVDFSVQNAGEYEVDYTQRKFVKIQMGSSVLYNNYQTIRVRKEGIEIRE